MDSLFGQIKGLLGKAYFLAGLLPAAMLLIWLKWLSGGIEGLSRFVASLLASKANLPSKIVLAAIAFLGLAFIFSASRSLVLHFFQYLPVPQGIRNWRIKAHEKRWREEESQLQVLREAATALTWHKHEFDRAGDSPIETPSEDPLRESKEARTTVESLASKGAELHSIPDHDLTLITKGLTQLRRLARKASARSTSPPLDARTWALIESEIRQWKELLQKQGPKRVLDLAETDCDRRYSHAYFNTRSSLPEDVKRIEPTTLGNRRAALDDYADLRYGIDTDTLWIRLWGVLSKLDRAEVNDAQLNIEILLNLLVALIVFAVVLVLRIAYYMVLALGADARKADWRAITSVIILPILMLLTFKAALFAFNAFTQKVIQLVDVNRTKLLKAMGFKTPATFGEAVNLLKELQEFFVQASIRDELMSRPLNPSVPEEKATGGLG